MGSLKNCILSVCLVLTAFVIAQINGHESVDVAHGVNDLAASLFQPVAKNNPGNILVSPFGLATALSMVAYASEGNTKAQFQKLLHLPSSYKVGCAAYGSALKDLKNLHGNEIKLGSKIFTSKKYPVKKAFTKMLRDYYDTENQSLNFNKSQEAAKIINAWVQSVAKDHPGHLEDLITPAQLGPKTQLVIVNPIYFKGKWLNGFNVNNTRQRPFKLNGNEVTNVPTMMKTSILPYGELPNGKASYVIVPFMDNELSMIIFLPKAVDGLAEVEKELPKASISSYIKTAKNRLVTLLLPRLKFHGKMDLKKALIALGLTDPFNNKANFSGITNKKIEISKILQNTHVEVDEEGGDIDTGTGDIASRIAVPPVNFNVNHPFHFVIVRNNPPKSNHSDVITLYSAHVTNPKA